MPVGVDSRFASRPWHDQEAVDPLLLFGGEAAAAAYAPGSRVLVVDASSKHYSKNGVVTKIKKVVSKEGFRSLKCKVITHSATAQPSPGLAFCLPIDILPPWPRPICAAR